METSLPRACLCRPSLFVHVYTFEVAPRNINPQLPDVAETAGNVVFLARDEVGVGETAVEVGLTSDLVG